MTDPLEFVARVKQYESKATKGPWHKTTNGIGHCTQRKVVRTRYVQQSETSCYPQSYEDWEPDFEQLATMESDDAHFCIGARQDLPTALSIIEQLVRERDESLARVKEAEKSLAYRTTECVTKGTPL